MLNAGAQGGPSRPVDWRELAVFCVMAVALVATSDNSSTVSLRTTAEGPDVTLDDISPTAAFLVTITAVGPTPDSARTVENSMVILRAEAMHAPSSGSPWVTVQVLGPAADAADDATEPVSFLRDTSVFIPSSFAGRCEPEEIDPSIADCSMQRVIRFTRAVSPGVSTSLTWEIEGQSSFQMDDDKSNTYGGDLPWQIRFARL